MVFFSHYLDKIMLFRSGKRSMKTKLNIKTNQQKKLIMHHWSVAQSVNISSNIKRIIIWTIRFHFVYKYAVLAKCCLYIQLWIFVWSHHAILFISYILCLDLEWLLWQNRCFLQKVITLMLLVAEVGDQVITNHKN